MSVPGNRVVLALSAAALVVALTGAAVIGWAMLHHAPAPAPAQVLSTPSPTAPTLSPVVAAACKRVTSAYVNDFTAVASAGTAAANSGDLDLKIEGSLLHDAAQLAAQGESQGASPATQLKLFGSVVSAKTTVVETCTRKGYRAN